MPTPNDVAKKTKDTLAPYMSAPTMQDEKKLADELKLALEGDASTITAFIRKIQNLPDTKEPKKNHQAMITKAENALLNLPSDSEPSSNKFMY